MFLGYFLVRMLVCGGVLFIDLFEGWLFGWDDLCVLYICVMGVMCDLDLWLFVLVLKW